jgi:hypothetical protein
VRKNYNQLQVLQLVAAVKAVAYLITKVAFGITVLRLNAVPRQA